MDCIRYLQFATDSRICKLFCNCTGLDNYSRTSMIIFVSFFFTHKPLFWKCCVAGHTVMWSHFPGQTFIIFQPLRYCKPFKSWRQNVYWRSGRNLWQVSCFNMKCSMAGFSRPRTVTVRLTSCSYLYLCFCCRCSGDGERKTHQS